MFKESSQFPSLGDEPSIQQPPQHHVECLHLLQPTEQHNVNMQLLVITHN